MDGKQSPVEPAPNPALLTEKIRVVSAYRAFIENAAFDDIASYRLQLLALQEENAKLKQELAKAKVAAATPPSPTA